MAEVNVSLAGKTWRYWEHITLQRSLDNWSTVTLTGPFDPGRREMRSALRPFAFQDLVVGVDANDVLTGTMMTPVPKTTDDAVTVEVSGFARPAVLMDTHLPADTFPLQWSGLDLAQVAEAICEPHGIAVDVEGEIGPAFARVKLEPDKAPGAFLAELARQRGKILRDSAAGSLLISESARTGRPVAQLVEGEAPLQEAAVTFSPQQYFSEITGLVNNKGRRRGAKHTETNPHLQGVVRPYSFRVEDVDKGDLPGAVAAKLARMFGNMVAYVVKVPTWYDGSGRLWEPNRTVSLKAPGAMVYDHYEFLIRDVILEQDGVSEIAALGLVLPGAFSGEAPEYLPWD